jgi:hypothetical protein
MRHTALRKTDGTDALEDSGSMPEARYPTVVTVHQDITTVTLAESPARAPHTGACACEACSAARLTALKIGFLPD